MPPSRDAFRLLVRDALRVGLVLVLGALGVEAEARGADLAILPAAITLDGSNAAQRVLVEETEGAVPIADATAKAQFKIDKPNVAKICPDGTITPLGNGKATLTATLGSQTARATITVKNGARPTVWSFRNHVLPVLTRAGCNSGACHGAAAGKGGLKLSLRGYAPEVDYNVLTRQALGRRIVKTAPAESLFLLKPTGFIEHGGGIRIEPDSPDYRILAEWIGAGLPPPRDDDPALVKIQAFPSAARLRPGRLQQVVVQATYANGRVEDVTRWAKFGSTDESVAAVDENGLVKIQGHGEAAVTVWFNNLVDLTTVTARYPTNLDPKRFTQAPRNNPIDDLNLTKLESLGIPPSGPCDDATFLRRAYLDATGTLPPESAFTRFVASDDPNKREKLVDQLLNSPEYLDYWTYKWSDVLLVSSKKLPAPAMWSFARWVRRAVAENLPWDEFARRILTATGSTLRNGAGNYFVLHRDPIDLTESTSVAFLGMSLTCARCHNHPMEKWTQDQYYGMANLFSRVKLKDGETPGDVEVVAVTEGEVLHPRKGVAMPPQPLDGAVVPADSRADRRATFAAWLALPENPYFDRAIVTRVWKNFLGRGLIDPEDDLRATNPPSDPALLDWLVKDFRAHKRDLKHLMRRIMTSAVYARSSVPIPGNEADQRFLSHYPVKRLPAEVLLDAIARVTEIPTPFSGFPAGWRSLQLPDVNVANTFLESFGRPEREAVCSCERSSDPSMAQALHLANGPTLNEKLRDDQGAPARLAASGASDDNVLETLFIQALSRKPTASERARLLPTLVEAPANPKDPRNTARRQAIEDLYWAVLTNEEFLFNH